jgi:CRISPR-associated protein Cas2
MLVLVSYDVATTTKEGRRRLRHVAKACVSFGQRVQFSVFECKVGPTEWAKLKGRLLDTYKPEEDSLRFYYLGEAFENRVEHHGTKPSIDYEGPLVV